MWGGLFFTDQLMHLFLGISFLSPSSTLLLLVLLLLAVMPQELFIIRKRIPFPSTNSSFLLSFSHSSSLSSLLDHFTLLASLFYNFFYKQVCQAHFSILSINAIFHAQPSCTVLLCKCELVRRGRYFTVDTNKNQIDTLQCHARFGVRNIYSFFL